MLGVFQKFCASFIWQCVRANAFQTVAQTVEERKAATCLIVREELSRFYLEYFRRSGQHLTEISDVTPQTVGHEQEA